MSEELETEIEDVTSTIVNVDDPEGFDPSLGDEPEQRDVDDSVAKDTSVDDSAGEEVAVDDSGDEQGESLQELAESFGMDADEASLFESPSDLLRWVRLKESLSKKVEKQPEAKEEPEATAVTPEETVDLSDFPLDPEKMREEGHDEATVVLAELLKATRSELVALRGTLDKEKLPSLEKRLEASESVMAEYQKRLQEETLYVENSQFHDTVDAWGSDTFGRTLDEDGKQLTMKDEQWEARKKLGEALDDIKARNKRDGITQPLKVMVNRAKVVAFPKEFEKEMRRKITGKAQNQSKRRLGSPTGTPSTSGPELSQEEIDRQALIQLAKKLRD